MAFLNWTHDLDTGISTVDDQHKKIVEYINQLDDIRHSHNREKIGEIMDALIDYTARHFAEEEDMLRRADYHLLEAHKSIHRRFVDKVSAMAFQHKQGADTFDEMMNLLENWLFAHIRVNDHGYVPTVQAAVVAGKVAPDGGLVSG